jgi:YcaO-like protein with predicted kinase domain
LRFAGLQGAEADWPAVLDRPVPKTFTAGTHRTSAPEETLARVKPLASRMGITRLGTITGLDRISIPVTIAVRPNSRSVSVSQGKGCSLPQALASALMEAAELFHGENLLPRTVTASFDDLRRRVAAVDPASLPGTGRPLPSSQPIPWIEGFDLIRREPCWVPWEVVHTDYTATAPHTGEHFLSGTNGLASGNHLVEALSAAICELVERDAVALWHARGFFGRAETRLDVDSVDDAACRGLFQTYQRAEVAARVFEVTSDLGIPAFVCDLSEGADARPGLRRFRGAGCHPDRTVALSRALTEAAQIRLTHIAGNRDDILAPHYAELPEQRLGAALLDAASGASTPRRFGDVASHGSPDLAADLAWMIARLRAIGAERVVAVDLTQPDLGIPVVRVVIPGIEWSCTHPDYRPGPRAQRAAGLSA